MTWHPECQGAGEEGSVLPARRPLSKERLKALKQKGEAGWAKANGASYVPGSAVGFPGLFLLDLTNNLIPRGSHPPLFAGELTGVCKG